MEPLSGQPPSHSPTSLGANERIPDKNSAGEQKDQMESLTCTKCGKPFMTIQGWKSHSRGKCSHDIGESQSKKRKTASETMAGPSEPLGNTVTSTVRDENDPKRSTKLRKVVFKKAENTEEPPNHQLATHPASETEKLRTAAAVDVAVQTMSTGNHLAVPLEKSMPTPHGRDILDDQTLTQHFGRLSSTIRQCSQHTKEDAQDISFLKSKLKDFESLSPRHKVLQNLREILVVPAGVDVNDQVEGLQLRNLDPQILTRAVLAIHVREMMFSVKSIFKDGKNWREELRYSLGLDVADMLLQNHRILILKSTTFREQMRQKMDNDVSRLNSAMFPLVGGNYITQDFHRELAESANEVHAKIGAFTGTWAAIWAGFGTDFDPSLHRRHPEDLSDENLRGQRILVTICPGIRRKISARDWWPCVKAIVVLDTRPVHSTAAQSKHENGRETYVIN